MSEPDWLAVLNPAAGGGRCGRQAEAVLASLRGSGFPLQMAVSREPGHATQLVRAAWARGVRRYLSVGGDGTAFEVLNGLFPHLEGDRPTLAHLPLGTGNSLAREFGIVSTADALAAIRSGRSTLIDVLKLEHKDGCLYFANLLGLGFAARVPELANRRYKWLGRWGYVWAVVESLIELSSERFPHRLAGCSLDTRDCTLLAFCNSKYTGGGMAIAPAADPSDGQLDVVRLAPVGRLGLLRAFSKIYAGTHVHLPSVEMSRTPRVEFESGPPVAVMIDGETMRLQLRSIEALPRALQLRA